MKKSIGEMKEIIENVMNALEESAKSAKSLSIKNNFYKRYLIYYNVLEMLCSGNADNIIKETERLLDKLKESKNEDERICKTDKIG